jgi:hydroxyacylglutathione hydrolase
MWASLSQIANLPDETVVYCAHEYTASNARFALSLDDSPELARRAEAIFAARARGEATVPTQIGLEKATNPFLRPQALAGALELLGQSDVSVFAALRAAKDGFKP